MVNFHDCDTTKLIESVAEEMKSMPELKAPDWSHFVKTGSQTQRAPENPDWWYIRSAAVLRRVAMLGPIGVSKLRVKFGGRKRRGTKSEHFQRAGGKIIRVILQQMSKAQLIKQTVKGVHKGKVITPKGISLLDRHAIKLIKNTPRDLEKAKKIVPKAKAPAEVPKVEQQ
jgi:small subunit ribosomal protein S19e